MRAREYPSGLIRAASKAPDLKVARSLPGGRVFGKMTAVHVLILPMRRESLERSRQESHSRLSSLRVTRTRRWIATIGLLTLYA
jgi:hypothetical protein